MVYSLNKSRGMIVGHEPKANDLQALRVLFQHHKWFIAPLNHKNMCIYCNICVYIGILLSYNNYIFHVVNSQGPIRTRTQYPISELLVTSFSNRGHVQNHSYEHEFSFTSK